MKTRKLRLVSALLALAMLFVMMPVGAFAVEGRYTYQYYDDIYTYTLNNRSEAEIRVWERSTGIPEYGGVSIPTYCDRNKVTQISEYIFYEKRIARASIPTGVKTIERWAFANCPLLTDISFRTPTGEEDISESELQTLGDFAFYGCSQLENMVLPGSLTSIGASPFNNCPNLTTVDYNGTQSQWEKIEGHNNVSQTVNYLKCEVVFHSSNHGNIEQPKSEIVSKGQKVVPPDMEENGWTLEGWYTTPTFDENSKYDFDTEITQDIDLYAKWAKTKYTVTFMSDYGIKPASQIVTYKEAVEKPEAVQEDIHYIFCGWYTDETYSNEFKFSGEDDAQEITSDTTVYAKWIPKEYEVILNYGSRCIPEQEKQIIKYGERIARPVSRTVDGWTIIGWHKDGEADEFDFNSLIEESIILNASWEQNTCTVTFHYNDEITPNKSMDVRYGTATNAPIVSKEKYQLVGWYDNENCEGEKFDFNNPITDDIDLYAKWEEIEIPVDPKPDDGNQVPTTKKTAKLTFSTDCIVEVDGNKIVSGDYVEVNKIVTLKLADHVEESGTKFSQYVISPIPDDLQYNGTTATFTMPEMALDVTVRLSTESESGGGDGGGAVIAAAAVIGIGAIALTYYTEVELPAAQILGKGVPVPQTREDVALKAWELAGKPAVELNGEPLSEAAQAEKWAVESGLMQNDANGSFNGAKKMNKLKALRVLDAAKKLA